MHRLFHLVGTLAALAPTTALGSAESIAQLLDRPAEYVVLSEAGFRALPVPNLPDAGAAVTALANAAPGGAFDPRDLARIDPARLGYRADWLVERYSRYGLPWDITGLRLTSLDPKAAERPWVVIMNGGAANLYEFYIDLRNRPGWGQYLAQKLNVMIVSIPGNFRYGGWGDSIATRRPAFLLDRDLTAEEELVYNSVFTNHVILQGLKLLLTGHTQGDLLLVGHSTSGELPFLAFADPELGPRLRGRFLGWGSGGPVRIKALIAAQRAADPNFRPAPTLTGGGGGEGRDWKASGDLWLNSLARRTPEVYSRVYSRWLNPLYEPGMSVRDIATAWLKAEERRRPNFKQPLQDLEHGDHFRLKADIEVGIEQALIQTGNPWKVDLEEVQRDLFATCYPPLSGYRRMVWCVAKLDGHWNPLYPAAGTDVTIAREFRRHNPEAAIRVIGWDLGITHYAHVELPGPLAAAFIDVVRWLDDTP